MTWLRKDEKVLGYEVTEMYDEEPTAYHYHKSCFLEIPIEGRGRIETHVTEEYLVSQPAKLLCDRCGEEIKA